MAFKIVKCESNYLANVFPKINNVKFENCKKFMISNNRNEELSRHKQKAFLVGGLFEKCCHHC